MGVDELPADLLRTLDVSDNFAAHCPGPIVLASDGGRIGGDVDADDPEETDETEAEAEHEDEAEDDQEDEDEEVTGLDQPKRSESADFGLGDSTGVQEL
jgi:hypothetical protein